MIRSLRTSLLIVGVLFLSTAVSVRPASAAVITGSYATITPQMVMPPTSRPVGVAVHGGTVTMPPSYAGDTLSDFGFALNLPSKGQATLQPTNETLILTELIGEEGHVSDTYHFTSGLTVTSNTSNHTASVMGDIALSGPDNIGGVPNPALFTVNFTNVNFDANWPVNPALPVGITFSIAPLQATTVPEPMSLALWGLMGGAAGAWLWRRRHRTA